MSALSLSARLPLATPAAPRPVRAAGASPLAAAAPALSAAEEAQIATAFPARPSVAQRLYGAAGAVHTPAPLGARLDLSA